MKLSRSLAIGVLLVLIGLAAFPQEAPRADAVAPVPPAVTGSDLTTQPITRKRHELIDANSVFFGCAAGTVVGALAIALPPLVGWTFYAGALPAIGALMASSGVGCTVGLFGGVILATFHWTLTTVDSAWRSVFG